MEKRFVLAFAVSMLILLAYPYFLQRPSPPQKALDAPKPSLPGKAAGRSLLTSHATPETRTASVVHEEKFHYENALYSATFTSFGAGITSLSLKSFASGVTQGNFLVEESKDAPPAFVVRVFENGVWAEGDYALENKEPLSVTFWREEPGRLRIKKSFWFLPNQYTFAVELQVENLSSTAQSFQCELAVPLFVADTPDQHKMDLEADYLREGQMEVKSASALAKQGFLKEGPLDWVALEKKYFTVIVKPELPIEHVRSSYPSGYLVHFLKPETFSIEPGKTGGQRFFVYAGPKDYQMLKNVQLGFEKILHTKVLGGLWIIFLLLLRYFYQIFHNYGVAIVVLSSLIKLLFVPLTHMSFESMRKMQALQPKLKALQEQHKKDPQKLNQEVMELYKKHKVNPFGGCLPLLLQMPIFVALYQTFSQAIELRGAPFVGWIKDLSEPDQLFRLPFSIPFLGDQVNLLPILMLGTMVWQQKLTPQTAATKEQEMMMTLMPILFGFIFYGLPSGLVIYWIVNNLLTIFHQIFMKKLHIAPAS